jgi:hypothetical protein
MLPNLAFMICGILFCLLLFAVTGAGIMLPDSRTRIGEMPEIGRPMMQRSMAEVPAQSQIYMMTARRSDELERLREGASEEIAAAPAQPPEPAPSKSAAEVMTDGPPREHVEPSVPVSAAEIESGDRRDEAGPPELAALSSPAVEDNEPVPRFMNVPLPPPRPAVFNGLYRHVRTFHHRRRVAPQHDTAPQGGGPGGAASQGIVTGYPPP